MLQILIINTLIYNLEQISVAVLVSLTSKVPLFKKRHEKKLGLQKYAVAMSLQKELYQIS
jgi:hypothetical protein